MQDDEIFNKKLKSLKTLVIGEPRNPFDSDIFHKVSLIALFAWVGLGSDAMSSASYGPEEAYLALGDNIYLAIFVAMSIILTIFVISTSYSQIIELFPTGGGGYLVASKLLSPSLGMLSGCALLIDYILTIAISIASGVDAMLSFLPPNWHSFKLGFAFFVIMVIILLNLRGVKESVLFLMPIFSLFIIAHVTLILYAFFTHFTSAPTVMSNTVTEVRSVTSGAGGLSALLFIILHSYSMGAGTYTGIEAVSNAVPVMREPRVKTAKKTMQLMAISLAFMAAGLMLAYILYNVSPEAGKTLNAVLFENITESWGTFGHYFVIATLVSEAGLLFVAAQTGFLDGPRVLANMALDRWVPTRFATLSDRLVTQNGILIMGISALAVVFLTQGSVKLLIVLYSIAVFITFILSQAGMVCHWWKSKAKVKDWKKKFIINGIGLILTVLILMSVIAVKFGEGGWVTLLIIGAFAGVVLLIRRHYDNASELIKALNSKTTPAECKNIIKNDTPNKINMQDKTAVLLVNGFNGLGMQALSTIFKLFGGMYKNFVFVQIGVIDAGVFKGAEEIQGLQTQVSKDADKYVKLLSSRGYYAEGFTSVGTDVVAEVTKLAPDILKKFPNAVFFGGQIVFPNDSAITRWLHNYTVFASQRKLYAEGIPFVVLPIKV